MTTINLISGVTLTINDDGTMTADTKIGKLDFGRRGTIKIQYWRAPSDVARNAGKPYALCHTAKRVFVTLTDAEANALDQAWPREIGWYETEPEDVKAWRAWRIHEHANHDKINQAIESGSSVIPRVEHRQEPQLSDDGRAWMALDAMRDSYNAPKCGAAVRACNDYLAGKISLVDAAARAKAEWDKCLDDHAFDC